MIDFFKIKDGELGAVNFNNMIPVTDKNYTLVDLNKETLTIAELKYQKLLKEQLNWLNALYRQVKISNPKNAFKNYAIIDIKLFYQLDIHYLFLINNKLHELISWQHVLE